MKPAEPQRRSWGLGLLGLLAAACCIGSCGGGGGSSGGGGGGVQPPTGGAAGPSVQVWLTTADQTRLLNREADLAFGDAAPAAANIDVDADRRYQEMAGFGAALTDASAALIQNRLNAPQRSALMQELFGPAPGIGLSFVRLTIGASDFSAQHYSLDDLPAGQTDPTLAHFSIERNRADVIPVMREALAINPRLKAMASPWSPPAWMKTSASLIGGSLRADAYGPLAEYLRRYVQAYAAEGVPIFALTVQNEPNYEPPDYPGMRFDAADRARFIGGHLGPLFQQQGIGTQILDWDHNWDHPEMPLQVLADAAANTFVKGVAWHCYAGDVSVQSTVHEAYPAKDAYFTECSGGDWATNWGANLGWNIRHLIIGATRHWAKGVLLWNLALDEHHGPHLGGCANCRGVVRIDSSTGMVTRNVEYYALAHASRFVRPGARRIESSTGVDGLETVAFRNADDGSVALIVFNGAGAQRSFTVRAAGKTFAHTLADGSVSSFSWMP